MFTPYQSMESVSDANNWSSDEAPWTYGPSSAMLGGDTTVCAWMHEYNWSDLDPDIYGDIDQ